MCAWWNSDHSQDYMTSTAQCPGELHQTNRFFQRGKGPSPPSSLPSTTSLPPSLPTPLCPYVHLRPALLHHPLLPPLLFPLRPYPPSSTPLRPSCAPLPSLSLLPSVPSPPLPPPRRVQAGCASSRPSRKASSERGLLGARWLSLPCPPPPVQPVQHHTELPEMLHFPFDSV